MSKYGIISEPGTLRFERLLPGPIDRVWSFLTESEKRAKWLASGEMELFKGGRVQLNFHHANLSAEDETVPDKYKQYEAGDVMIGRITDYDPPRLLSYTWGPGEDSEVSFHLTPAEENVQLVLTHSKLADNRDVLLSVASGWHTYLTLLTDHLNGRKPSGFWSTHTRMEEKYGQRLR
ncbi:MAG: SRPBCC family protein [Balneolaceae bacterium]